MIPAHVVVVKSIKNVASINEVNVLIKKRKNYPAKILIRSSFR